MTGSGGAPDFGALGFDRALQQLGEALATRPEAAAAVWQRFASDCMAAGIATMASAGGETVEPAIAPERGDRRFRDPAWQENPAYAGMLQGYLLWSRMLRELVDVAELDRATDRKARFAVDAMIDALAPTNTLLGNPAAMRRAFETGGASVPRGRWSSSSTISRTTTGGRARSTCRSSRSARTSPPPRARSCSGTS